MELVFRPEQEGIVEGAVEVGQRSVAITGRGVSHAVRVLMTPMYLGDVASGACLTATAAVGNPGLGIAPLGSIELNGGPTATARWLRDDWPSNLLALEEHMALVEICPERQGPLDVTFSLHGEVLATLSGQVRGSEIEPRGPIDLPPLIISLPRVVTATLANPGRRRTVLNDLRAEGPDREAIEVLTPNLDIEPGRTAAVRLRVTPGRIGSIEATLVARTNISDQSALQVPIRGAAIGSHCVVQPDRLDAEVGTLSGRWVQSDWSFTNLGVARCAILLKPPEAGPIPALATPLPTVPWDEEHLLFTVGPSERAVIPLAFEIAQPGAFDEETKLIAARQTGSAQVINIRTSGVKAEDGLSYLALPTPPLHRRYNRIRSTQGQHRGLAVHRSPSSKSAFGRSATTIFPVYPSSR